ncbi:MAG: hypothetical protein R3E79_51350 [Caldilineaceae bacterium]
MTGISTAAGGAVDDGDLHRVAVAGAILVGHSKGQRDVALRGKAGGAVNGVVKGQVLSCFHQRRRHHPDPKTRRSHCPMRWPDQPKCRTA